MKNDLIGKTIVELKMADDKQAMLFITDAGDKLVVMVDGDCCSHSWIESVELPALGLPFSIVSVEDLELNADLDDQGGELAFYGAKIVTDKGDMIIDYRNESNGYYGGSIYWPGSGENYYGGVHGQNESSFNWVEVKDAG